VTPIDWAAPFASLRVGDGFCSRGRTITEADVVSFASLTGDWHPQHADANWAKDSPFGERIAHGMLIISYATGLVPLDPTRVLALRRINDVVFKRPVTLGETIHVRGSIASLRPVDDRAGLVKWHWNIENHHDQLACRAQVELLWRNDDDTLAWPAGDRRARAPLVEYPPGVVPC
jgi:3-hydroxybutyryl-CoA dehydratase